MSDKRGFLRVPNDLLDEILPTLDPCDQVVLLRLYRLSRGFNKDSCVISLSSLAKKCGMSRSRVQKAIALLINRGYIKRLNRGNKQDVSAFLILLPGVPPRGIPQEGIPPQGIPQRGIETLPGIPPRGNNKKHEEELKENTHTHNGAAGAYVSVRSKFSLEECRRYADHLHDTSQGINNPGGYATSIYRSGEIDLEIEKFLNQQTLESQDMSKCPDCTGIGFIYPEGIEKGKVAKCNHPRLQTALAIYKNMGELVSLHKCAPDYTQSDLIEDLRYKCDREYIPWEEDIVNFLLDRT